MELIKDILPQIHVEIKERLDTPRTTKDKWVTVEDMKWLLQQRSLPEVIPVEERRYHLSYVPMMDSIANSVGQKALIKTLETKEAGIRNDIVDEYLEEETKALNQLDEERGGSPDYIAPHSVSRSIPNWLRRRPWTAPDPKAKDESTSSEEEMTPPPPPDRSEIRVVYLAPPPEKKVVSARKEFVKQGVKRQQPVKEVTTVEIQSHLKGYKQIYPTGYPDPTLAYKTYWIEPTHNGDCDPEVLELLDYKFHKLDEVTDAKTAEDLRVVEQVRDLLNSEDQPEGPGEEAQWISDARVARRIKMLLSALQLKVVLIEKMRKSVFLRQNINNPAGG